MHLLAGSPRAETGAFAEDITSLATDFESIAAASYKALAQVCEMDMELRQLQMTLAYIDLSLLWGYMFPSFQTVLSYLTGGDLRAEERRRSTQLCVDLRLFISRSIVVITAAAKSLRDLHQAIQSHQKELSYSLEAPGAAIKERFATIGRIEESLTELMTAWKWNNKGRKT